MLSYVFGVYVFPFSDLPTCHGAPVDLVAHHVHLLLVVRPAEQLRVLDHILIAGAQPCAAHHANETLFVEHALARPHHQFPGRDVVAATAATPVHAPVADKQTRAVTMGAADSGTI